MGISKPVNPDPNQSAIRALTFTTLYPDKARPLHGIFVENRLRRLVSSGKVCSRVMAPVPWFPFRSTAWGSYSRYARVPYFEVRHGIDVEHPRYPLIPKAGMAAAPYLMAIALKRRVSGMIEHHYDFDLIDAHYFYPDGVAAAMIGGKVGRPVVITARGTDINLIPEFGFPRKLIRWAADRAEAIITVCQALKDRLIELGVREEKITVLRNGVDLNLFSPARNRQAERDRLGISRKMLLSVGALIPRKGHDLIIRALPMLPDCKLFIAGEGPQDEDLHCLVESLNLGNRVSFLGGIAHEKLHDYYGAADALVLASDREGWANVLLESMACGTPVVATRIWGTPEIVTTAEAGVLIPERTAEAIAAGVQELFSMNPDRTATRIYAERFSWDQTTAGQETLFGRVVSRNRTSDRRRN
jgi:teichuronic acid biosynthesis glycosyltransferase TuaC